MLTFFRKKMKGILIAVAFIFVASMFYGIISSRGSGGGTASKGELAKVNGRAVSPLRYREIMSRLLGQFGKGLRPQDLAFVQNMALNQAIDFTLILQEAGHRGVRVSGQEVKLAIQGILKQENLASEKELARSLQRIGLTLSKFKEMIKNEITVQKMAGKIRNEVKVGPDDLREVKASHILVSNEALAKEIRARLDKGESFAKLAQKYSLDPGSKDKGGNLGFFSKGTMVAPFEKEAFKLKIGEISQPVKTSFGYHIITVTDSRIKKFKSDEKDIKKAALLEKQGLVFRRWFSELKSKAKIEIINPMLRAHDLRFKGRAFEAVQEYKKAIAADPGNGYLHVFLADTYDSTGKTDLAVAEYEKAISVDGGNPAFYMLLAELYEKNKQTKKALGEYKRASLVAGDNKALHQELIKKFTALKAWSEVANEKAEIKKIEKKEAFEKELNAK